MEGENAMNGFLPWLGGKHYLALGSSLRDASQSARAVRGCLDRAFEDLVREHEQVIPVRGGPREFGLVATYLATRRAQRPNQRSRGARKHPGSNRLPKAGDENRTHNPQLGKLISTCPLVFAGVRDCGLPCQWRHLRASSTLRRPLMFARGRGRGCLASTRNSGGEN